MCKPEKSHSTIPVISIYSITFAADFQKQFTVYGKKFSDC